MISFPKEYCQIKNSVFMSFKAGMNTLFLSEK